MSKGFVEVTFIKDFGTRKKGSKVTMHESTAKGLITNGFVSFGEVTEEKTAEAKPKAAKRNKTK